MSSAREAIKDQRGGKKAPSAKLKNNNNKKKNKGRVKTWQFVGWLCSTWRWVQRKGCGVVRIRLGLHRGEKFTEPESPLVPAEEVQGLHLAQGVV